MKIALIGYGKMGRAIERIAISRGHTVVCRIDIDNRAELDSDAFRSADVAIEFTAPAAAFDNCRDAMAQGVPVVSGSTGWTARLPELMNYCAEHSTTLMWASNYSLGVNVFFRLNRMLASMLAPLDAYTPEITEIHHIHKLDHPSGTAITLAGDIIERSQVLNGWSETPSEGSLLINHERIGEVPGTHTVKWDSVTDCISITHEAHSRDGFALGAVVAAEWVAKGHRGFLTMDMMMDEIIPRNN